MRRLKNQHTIASYLLNNSTNMSLSLSLSIYLLCLPLTPHYILQAPNRGNTFFPSSSAILLSIPLKFMTFLCSPVYTHIFSLSLSLSLSHTHTHIHTHIYTYAHKLKYNYNTTGKTTSMLTDALCSAAIRSSPKNRLHRHILLLPSYAKKTSTSLRLCV
jgi:hypothetical protein